MRFVVAGLVAALTLAAVVILGLRAARDHAPPARCPDGLVAMGPRCCAEGQREDRGACLGEPARCPVDFTRTPRGCVAREGRVRVAAGRLVVAPTDWEAAGIVSARAVDVGALWLDRVEVTNARLAACADPGCPRAPADSEPGAPATRVTLAEADAFCRWASGRLPTADELAFAAAGSRGRRYAWGDTGAVCRRASYGLVAGPCATGATGPELAGARPDGASPEGALDLAGNVAELTALATSGRGYAEFAVARGGSFADDAAAALRSWHAQELRAVDRRPDVGFRCAYDRAAP